MVLSGCLTPIPDNVGYEVNGRSVRWVGVGMGSVLAEVYRVDLRDVDVATFRALSVTYAVDARRVYYQGRALEGEDPAVFRVLSDGYAAGSARVYFMGEALPGATPATWRRYEGTGFSTDGARVFSGGALLEGADGATFRVRPHAVQWRQGSNEYVARDARNFYRQNIRIGSAEDCGRRVGEGPNWVDGGFHLYWGQEELDYLCADLKLPGETAS
jgi:hypothetical protein